MLYYNIITYLVIILQPISIHARRRIGACMRKLLLSHRCTQVLNLEYTQNFTQNILILKV